MNTTFRTISVAAKLGAAPPSQRDPKKYGEYVNRRLDAFGQLMESGHKKYAKNPHWYL